MLVRGSSDHILVWVCFSLVWSCEWAKPCYREGMAKYCFHVHPLCFFSPSSLFLFQLFYSLETETSHFQSNSFGSSVPGARSALDCPWSKEWSEKTKCTSAASPLLLTPSLTKIGPLEIKFLSFPSGRDPEPFKTAIRSPLMSTDQKTPLNPNKRSAPQWLEASCANQVEKVERRPMQACRHKNSPQEPKGHLCNAPRFTKQAQEVPMAQHSWGCLVPLLCGKRHGLRAGREG